jgi:hypothetical protein
MTNYALAVTGFASGLGIRFSSELSLDESTLPDRGNQRTYCRETGLMKLRAVLSGQTKSKRYYAH